MCRGFFVARWITSFSIPVLRKLMAARWITHLSSPVLRKLIAASWITHLGTFSFCGLVASVPASQEIEHPHLVLVAEYVTANCSPVSAMKVLVPVAKYENCGHLCVFTPMADFLLKPTVQNGHGHKMRANPEGLDEAYCKVFRALLNIHAATHMGYTWYDHVLLTWAIKNAVLRNMNLHVNP